MQQPMMNVQINQLNQMINQMPNQVPKMQQMNQILINPQQQQPVNDQMMDPNMNANMNQITIINQMPPNQQIITQNQPMNQVPNQHMQPNQQIQRIPLQQGNRMILSGTTQVQVRAGQIIPNPNFHPNRMRAQHPNQNIPMQQHQQQQQKQQPNEQYFQQPQLNQQINPQFQQQPMQNNNMNQMPMSNNTIQMISSPGSYVLPNLSSNVMGSPINVNVMNQRTGGSSVMSGASPNPHANRSLNTPANYRKPNFNHTLQRTIGPVVSTIDNSYEYSTYKKSSEESLPEEDIPHVVKGEIARLDDKYYIEFDPVQHSQSKTIHLICRIDDFDLPCVPPISIQVPMCYPNRSPNCYIEKEAYSSSKFFQDIHKIFNSNLEKLPKLYSITTLLNRWELSIRETLNRERVF